MRGDGAITTLDYILEDHIRVLAILERVGRSVTTAALEEYLRQARIIIAETQAQLSNKDLRLDGRRLSGREFHQWRAKAVSVLSRAQRCSSDFQMELKKRNLDAGEGIFRERLIKQQAATMLASWGAAELAAMDDIALRVECNLAIAQATRVIDMLGIVSDAMARYREV